MNENIERDFIAIIEPDGRNALEWQYPSPGLPPDVQAWQEKFHA
ncbi:MAG: hypothetical protein PHC92_03830 [Syntrophomonadaceae bacterium]|nr:hypothetical protein [Syntrophomonadaceae bacterium]MDD3024251.1 hypothetical protein [Syntrophomonadaceae bacterium]